MKTIQSFLKRLRGTKPTPTSPPVLLPLQSNLFDKLPVELLHYITDFLPLSSTVALTLCSRNLSTRLDSAAQFSELNQGKFEIRDYFSTLSLSLQQSERQTFLLLLERDIEDKIFCYFCQPLHGPNARDYGSHAFSRKPCLEPDTQWLLGYYFHKFNYCRIYNIMKLHRQGLDAADVLACLSKTFTMYHGITHQISLLPRILSGKLYLRTQHRLLLPRGSPLRLPSGLSYLFCVCSHTVVTLGASTSDLAKRIDCRLSHHPGGPCPSYSEIRSCRLCETDFQIDLKQLTNGRSVLVVTKWQDFGEIRTPFDPKWRERFRSPINPPPHPLGSIKVAFEGDNTDFLRGLTKKEEAAIVPVAPSLQGYRVPKYLRKMPAFYMLDLVTTQSHK